jgi:site-specific DNA-adenine methylase
MGAKSGSMGKWIVDFIPKDIKVFSEPFSGMFNVYLTMDLDKYPYLDKVIYNDFNVLNANIFACARKYKEFYTFLESQQCQQRRKDGSPTDPNFKKWFDEYQKEIFTNQPELDIDDNNLIKSKIVSIIDQVSTTYPLNFKTILKKNSLTKYNNLINQIYKAFLKRKKQENSIDFVFIPSTFSEFHDIILVVS